MPHAHPSGFPPRCLAVPVARGPVPRERQPARKLHANQRRFPDRGMARDRPSPYGNGDRTCALRATGNGTGPRPTATETQPDDIERAEVPETGPRPTATETGLARYGQAHTSELIEPAPPSKYPAMDSAYLPQRAPVRHTRYRLY